MVSPLSLYFFSYFPVGRDNGAGGLRITSTPLLTPAPCALGEIKNFTGISDPYEAPQQADIVLDTGLLSLEQSVQQLLQLLRERGIIRASAGK